MENMYDSSQPMGLTPELTSPAQVFGLLDRVARRLRTIHQYTVRDAGLTPAQYHVLVQLWQRGEQPLGDLAKACDCTRPTITGIVDTLVRNGLVVRVPNPNDRRSVLASLTERGRALQDTTPQLTELYGSCCEGLSASERRVLHQLLGKLDVSLRCGPAEEGAPCE